MSGVNAPVNGCWCRPATNDLVTVYDDGTVIVRDLADGKQLHRLSLPIEKIHDLCSGLSPDGLRLLTGHDDNSISLWSLADGGLRHRFKLDRYPDRAAGVLAPDGRFAVAHTFRSREYFWRLPEPEPADRADSLARKDAAPRPAVAPRPALRLSRPPAGSPGPIIPSRRSPSMRRSSRSGQVTPTPGSSMADLLAGRGQSAEADAAFLRASRLAPNDFQPFLDQWWIVGPYVYDVRAMGHPQNRPDPSQPILVDTRAGGPLARSCGRTPTAGSTSPTHSPRRSGSPPMP